MARTASLALLVLLALSPALHAQDGPPPRREPPGQGAPQQQQPHRTLLPPDSVTQHDMTLGGKKMTYSATAGALDLKDAQGETTAEIFYVSFTLANAGDLQHRPVTYLMNGGPGAGSAYLDIGAIGPRVLEFAGNGEPLATSRRVADNPDSWLPFTDLVFIDPVGTGFSRATDPDKAAKEFWGVSQDLDEIADFIRLHLAKTGRLTSPVYLVGESYGGFRVARLAQALATDSGVGIAPAGIVMISPATEFGLLFGGPLNPLPLALRLPSFAAAQLGAKALDPGALDDVEHFAMHDYLTALAAGPLEGPAAKPLYDKLAALTGLDADQIASWQGRIPTDAFLEDYRRNKDRVLSHYDATVGEIDPNPWDPDAHGDPVLDATVASFTSAFVAYVRDELGFKTDQPYQLLNRDVGRQWSWGGSRFATRSVGASGQLRQALALDPRLKVMIVHGVADLVTPYMTSRYIKDEMPEALGRRIELKLYAGGHMAYLRAASRHLMHDDAAKFYGAAE